MLNKAILTDQQCAVQSSHAVSEYMWHNHNNPKVKNWIENYVTKVILQGTPEDMDYMTWYHQKNSLSYREFFESDLNSQRTAIAFEPTDNYDIFKKYELI